MSHLTGQFKDKVVHVGPDAIWSDIALVHCVIEGNPRTSFRYFRDVVFIDCIFAYDGLPVDGEEWMAFVLRAARLERA